MGSTGAARPNWSGAISRTAGEPRPLRMALKASRIKAGTSEGWLARSTQSITPPTTAIWSFSSWTMP